MWNTCRPMAVSFQCLTKFTTKKKREIKHVTLETPNKAISRFLNRNLRGQRRMGWYIYSKCWKKKKLPNKNILASKAFFHKWGTFALGQTKAKSVTTTFKLKDLKGEIDNNTRVAGNLIFHLQQWIDQSYIKKKKIWTWTIL